jgi:ketosteroid isomerase-like protein
LAEQEIDDMKSSSPSAIVASFWSAFAERQFERVFAEHLAEGCEFTLPGMPPLVGAEAIGALFQSYVRAFPDFAARTLHAIESGDTYAAETAFSGTHQGPLQTPQGALAPTFRKVTWQSADIVRTAGGKIVSWHVYHDPLPLLAQLGVAAV